MGKHRKDGKMNERERDAFIKAMAKELFHMKGSKYVKTYAELSMRDRWEYEKTCERLLEAGEHAVRSSVRL